MPVDQIVAKTPGFTTDNVPMWGRRRLASWFLLGLTASLLELLLLRVLYELLHW